MKICVTCRCNNKGVKFIGSQCPKCFELSPIKDYGIAAAEKEKWREIINKVKEEQVKKRLEEKDAIKPKRVYVKKKNIFKEKKERHIMTFEERFPEKKGCSKCKKIKHISCFGECVKSGIKRASSWCRECQRKDSRLYRKRIKENKGK